jgi:hypothetical protein
MSTANHTPEEVAERGESLYAAGIRDRLTEEDEGKFVAIDIETGVYEIDDNELAAMQRTLAKRPRSVLYVLRVGHPAAHRMGSAAAGTMP